jgi:hypothetical protein
MGERGVIRVSSGGGGGGSVSWSEGTREIVRKGRPEGPVEG